LLLFVLLAAIGCESTAVTVGGKPRPKRYQGVVSLSPSTTEIVASLGSVAILKGRTQADDFPRTISEVPVVASVKPDYEKIASANPGLIVYDAVLYNAQDVEKIKGLGADVFDFKANTVEEFNREVLRLGSLLAAETTASTYVDRIVGARNTALASAPATKPKVAVILPSPDGNHYINGTDSFLTDVVRSAGGDPIGPKADRFVALSPEFLISQNPDAIVIGVEASDKAGAAKLVDAVLADARLKSVKAIANRKIIAIDSDVLTRRGYRVDKLIENLGKSFAGLS
jgi:ABC-type Fe3+-hydroxamate transport system substrate-binding protein